MHHSIVRAVFVLPLAILAGACQNNTPTTPTAPTAPTTVTETFSGTLTPNGGVTHTFVTGSAGTVQAMLTLVEPDAGNPIGLSLGTWNGVTCAIVLANDRAVQSTVVTGTVTSVGNLCARVYDVGTLADPVNYEVLVTHP